jgi:predicted lipoprotein with Yx(FWY)xxD motif
MPVPRRPTAGSLVAAALTLVLASALAGCGSGSSHAASATTAPPTSAGATDATGSTTTTAAPTSGPTDATFPPGTATVTSSSSPLGPILVDGTGHTLYAYVPDGAGGVPTCVGDCAKAWPPVTGTYLGVSNTVPVQPHEFKLVLIPGTVTKQLVVNGHPLYRFSGDGLAGEIKGQGLDHQWYVVGIDGQPITKAAPTTTTG